MAFRAQIELSMLTRFAMIFFIISLAAMMLNLSSMEKSHLCSSQAQSLTQAIAGQISQVINSPVEDERRIYPLTGSFAIGKEEFSRYNINITKHYDQKQKSNSFTVEVAPLVDASCNSRSDVYFNKTGVQFIPPTEITNLRGDEILVLDPSTPDIKSRSRYLVIIKCQPKQWGQGRVIFIEDCRNPDPTTCASLESETIKLCCGFPPDLTDSSWSPEGCPAQPVS